MGKTHGDTRAEEGGKSLKHNSNKVSGSDEWFILIGQITIY